MATVFCLPAYLHAPCVGVRWAVWCPAGSVATILLHRTPAPAIILRPLELGTKGLLCIPLEKSVLKTRAVGSYLGVILSLRLFGSIWRHFCLSQLGMGVSSVATGFLWIDARDTAILFAVHTRQTPWQRITQLKIRVVPWLRNPAWGEMVKMWACTVYPSNSLLGILQNLWLSECLETDKSGDVHRWVNI